MTTPDVLICVGRTCLGSLFAISGFRHFFILPEMREFLASRRVPAPMFSLLVATSVQVFAGIALIAGAFVLVSAVCLILFTLMASMVALDFWNVQGGARVAALQAWQANIAVIGGLFLVVAQHIGRSG